jgi:hypothetical protein
MSDFIHQVMQGSKDSLERERYKKDLYTPVKRERELYEAGNLTNCLDMSDSSEDDPSEEELPLRQFDKYPKSDCLFAFHHPQPTYISPASCLANLPNGKHCVTMLAERAQ